MLDFCTLWLNSNIFILPIFSSIYNYHYNCSNDTILIPSEIFCIIVPVYLTFSLSLFMPVTFISPSSLSYLYSFSPSVIHILYNIQEAIQLLHLVQQIGMYPLFSVFDIFSIIFGISLFSIMYSLNSVSIYSPFPISAISNSYSFLKEYTLRIPALSMTVVLLLHR